MTFVIFRPCFFICKISGTVTFFRSILWPPSLFKIKPFPLQNLAGLPALYLLGDSARGDRQLASSWGQRQEPSPRSMNFGRRQEMGKLILFSLLILSIPLLPALHDMRQGDANLGN